MERRDGKRGHVPKVKKEQMGELKWKAMEPPAATCPPVPRLSLQDEPEPHLSTLGGSTHCRNSELCQPSFSWGQ